MHGGDLIASVLAAQGTLWLFTLVGETLAHARALAKTGRPVLINARIGTSDFRKGSLSV